MTTNDQTNLSQRIIEHLRPKEDGRDDLDGIVIAIYEKEMKKLSANIMNDLAELLAKGIVSEYVEEKGKRYYTLIKSIDK